MIRPRQLFLTLHPRPRPHSPFAPPLRTPLAMKIQFITSLLLLAGTLMGQTYNLTVTTTDAETRNTLGFVNVQVEGTSANGTSDAEGRLTLEVPAGEVVLLASFLGYEALRQKSRFSATRRASFWRCALRPSSSKPSK